MRNSAALLAHVLVVGGVFVGGAAAWDRTVGLIYRDSAAAEGYTLFAPIPYNQSYLIDQNGDLVHSWSATLPPGQAVYLNRYGQLMRACDKGSVFFGQGGRDGRVVWSYDYSVDSQYCQHTTSSCCRTATY